MIVVDTSVLIGHLSGRTEARNALQRAVSDRQVLAAPVLTRLEVMAGVRSAERGATEALLRAPQWAP